MSDYKTEQKRFRELAKPKFYPKGTEVPDTIDNYGAVHKLPNGYPVSNNRKLALPEYTKSKQGKRIAKLTRERVLRVEEIRHIYSLVRKGKFAAPNNKISGKKGFKVE